MQYVDHPLNSHPALLFRGGGDGSCRIHALSGARIEIDPSFFRLAFSRGILCSVCSMVQFFSALVSSLKFGTCIISIKMLRYCRRKQTIRYFFTCCRSWRGAQAALNRRGVLQGRGCGGCGCGGVGRGCGFCGGFGPGRSLRGHVSLASGRPSNNDSGM